MFVVSEMTTNATMDSLWVHTLGTVIPGPQGSSTVTFLRNLRLFSEWLHQFALPAIVQESFPFPTSSWHNYECGLTLRP